MSNVLADSQFQPPQVYVEGTWLYGAIVTAILYGIIVVLYLMCARSLWGQIRSRDGAQTKNWFFFIYVNFIFALSTLYVAANSKITQLGFIDHRDYPGGPSAYEINTSSPPLNTAFVVSNWCADALMIWRCVVVYRDSKFHRIVTGFGCLMFLASVGKRLFHWVDPPSPLWVFAVTGSLWVIIVSQPAQSATGWMSFSFLFPYLSVSLAINIFICILTVLRLLYHRACISRVLGPGYGMLYTSFAAMIVESAAVYAICSLLYLVPYAINSPLANAFMQILGEAQVIAPLLIIYRVSEGKAWTREMATRLATPGSQAMHRLSTQPTPTSSRPRGLLNIQVALEGAQHTEREGSIQFADEEDKDFTM
ncbi:hypothetical protein J3R83DRAFT_13860 [Lanmaoa asiatica]|nr:hypothetical protein J3R83DRAFT_13860 [Lanmaoa asiatica]